MVNMEIIYFMNSAAGYSTIPTQSADNFSKYGASLEEVRRAHLSHENAFKALGGLYLLSGLAFGFWTLLLLLSLVLGKFQPSEEIPTIGAAFGVIAIGCFLSILFLSLGRNLRKLKPKAGKDARLLSCLGLFAFPIGTIFHAMVLYYLLSEKGRFVFSEGYLDIVKQTPGVKLRESKLVKAFLTVIVVFLLAVAGLIVSLPFIVDR